LHFRNLLRKCKWFHLRTFFYRTKSLQCFLPKMSFLFLEGLKWILIDDDQVRDKRHTFLVDDRGIFQLLLGLCWKLVLDQALQKLLLKNFKMDSKHDSFQVQDNGTKICMTRYLCIKFRLILLPLNTPNKRYTFDSWQTESHKRLVKIE